MSLKRDTLGQNTGIDLKWGNGKILFQVNGNDMKVEVAILISDKTDFKTKPTKIKKCTTWW